MDKLDLDSKFFLFSKRFWSSIVSVVCLVPVITEQAQTLPLPPEYLATIALIGGVCTIGCNLFGDQKKLTVTPKPRLKRVK